MSEEPSSLNASPSSLPVWRALLVGWLWVNIPATVIILGVWLIGLFIELRLWWMFLAIGGFLGWTWWSFTIARWRNWAVARGVPPDKLQRWGTIVLLTWRKGSIFEKTEIRPRD
jgi:hypothetical protein